MVVVIVFRPCQVKQLDGAAPFPAAGDRDTLYVKVSWDTKTFRVLDSAVVNPSTPDPSPVRHCRASFPPSPPSSPPAAAPASRGPARRALPTPDLAVMRRAATLEVRSSRVTMSAGRGDPSEAESLHSATKLSASKCLSAKRRDAMARVPGIRKRLQLSSENSANTPHATAALAVGVKELFSSSQVQTGSRSPMMCRVSS